MRGVVTAGALEIALFAICAPAPAAPADPNLAGYKDAMARAKQAVSREKWADAIAALEAARREAQEPAEGGPRSAAAALEQGRIELKRKHGKVALGFFRDASVLALDDLRLRDSAMALRRRAAKEAKLADELKRIEELSEHDRKLREHLARFELADAARDKALRALDEAARAFERDKDKARAALVVAAKARVLAASRQPEQGLELARGLLEDSPPPLPHVRRRALEAAHRAGVAMKDVQAEVRYAALLNALDTEKLPAERRRYTRTRALERACAKLDRDEGPGACAKLAHEVTGEFSFQDHSRGRPRRSLSGADIESAHAQYLPAIQECLFQAAKASESAELFDDVSITVGWTIDPKGMAIEPELSPRRYDDVLGACVRERVGWVRYPRTLKTAERQTVAIPWHLSARDPRPPRELGN